MRPDRRLEHLVGKRHEPVLDGAEKRRRPFDKAADLVDEPLVRPQLRPGGVGQRGGALDDGGTAAGRVDHDLTVQKPPLILVGACDTRQVDVFRAFEIMAAACRREGKRCPAKVQLAGKRRPAEQQVDAMQRPHPAEPRGAPALAFRPGKLGKDLGKHRGDQSGRSNPGTLDPREQEPPLRRVLLDKPVAAQAGRFQEPLDGLVGRVGPWPAPLLADILLPFGDAVDIERQMTRRHEPAGRAMRQPGLAKAGQHQPFKVGRRPRLHAGRNFLADDLDQKVSHRRPPHPCPPRWCRRRSRPRSSRVPAPAPARYRRRVRSPR